MAPAAFASGTWVATLSKIVGIANLASMVGNGIAQAGTSVVMKQIAALQAQIDDLQQLLAKIDVETQQLLQQVSEKSDQEDEVKEDIEDRQDLMDQMTTALSKAADSYAEMLAGTNFLS
jgi:hypothetical protein